MFYAINNTKTLQMTLKIRVLNILKKLLKSNFKKQSKKTTSENYFLIVIKKKIIYWDKNKFDRVIYPKRRLKIKFISFNNNNYIVNKSRLKTINIIIKFKKY